MAHPKMAAQSRTLTASEIRRRVVTLKRNREAFKGNTSLRRVRPIAFAFLGRFMKNM
jgi:hypothetical protein